MLPNEKSFLFGNTIAVESQDPGLVHAYLSYSGLEKEAVSWAGVSETEAAAERQASLMWASELGRQMCSTWPGQAEISQLSRRAQRLAYTS